MSNFLSVMWERKKKNTENKKKLLKKKKSCWTDFVLSIVDEGHNTIVPPTATKES